MTLLRRVLLAALLPALSLPLVNAPARADDFTTVFLDELPSGGSARGPRAEVLGTPTVGRKGGYGWVTVRLKNPDAERHVVDVSLGPRWGYASSSRSARYVVRKRVVLEAGEGSTVHLPLASMVDGARVSYRLDGLRTYASTHVRSTRRSGGADVNVLRVGRSDPSATASLESFLTAERRRRPARTYRGSGDVHLVSRAPELLPDQWVLLSGFDLVLVDCRASGLTAEHERMLRRYAAGAGHLVLQNLSDDAQGPLAELCAGTETEGTHGFGRWLTVSGTQDAQRKALARWFGAHSSPYGILGGATRAFSGGLPTPFWVTLEIPGLGEVPVRAFFFLILAFAIVVGPVSYVYFRRRRRLPMLLVTIPAVGFACTAAILGYGILSEGLGIIGSERSLTILDQRDHTAVTCTGRTLYAGLQPAALTPSPSSFFYSADFSLGSWAGRGQGPAFRVDLDGGYHVDGSALPSRTPTSFISASVGRARERLRFRRRPDGGFDMLAAPGFTPTNDGRRAVLLRTHDGAYYTTGATETLVPLAQVERHYVDAISAMQGPIARMPLQQEHRDTRRRRGRFYTPSHDDGGDVRRRAVGVESLTKWFDTRLRRLPKGSYLARMEQAPLYDDLGLEVAWRSSEHLVLGYLAEEDVIDE